MLAAWVVCDALVVAAVAVVVVAATVVVVVVVIVVAVVVAALADAELDHLQHGGVDCGSERVLHEGSFSPSICTSGDAEMWPISLSPLHVGACARVRHVWERRRHRTWCPLGLNERPGVRTAATHTLAGQHGLCCYMARRARR